MIHIYLVYHPVHKLYILHTLYVMIYIYTYMIVYICMYMRCRCNLTCNKLDLVANIQNVPRI